MERINNVNELEKGGYYYDSYHKISCIVRLECIGDNTRCPYCFKNINNCENTCSESYVKNYIYKINKYEKQLLLI